MLADVVLRTTGRMSLMPDYENAIVTPLDTVENQERYRLYSQPEVVQVLKGLAKKPEIITAYFDDYDRHILTAVMGVLPEKGRLILDYGPDDTLNRFAAHAERLICVTKQDRIDIRFECGTLKPTRYEGHPAFETVLPRSVLRLQRRNYFRVPTLVTKPVVCSLVVDEATSYELAAVDISLGGVGLIDPDESLDCERGDIFPDSVIDLPDVGRFNVEIEVRNFGRYVLGDGRVVRRIGVAFGSLSSTTELQIQRLH
ncbi:hypothetical protein CAL65_02505 [Alkalilimnicola ehrlichii]|uniref:Flagellar brake protein YcgR n=2 Tax=Alkalilimnicola ehrlichii TaxID=351052 RepID=A0A3E0X056_9GAMM|nr:hypothetical protein CAL65_02505 [Alkalilimnicola ehrlichii]